ncbi:MAG: CGNR zinc finger domain-containing protein [Gemmatimonadaceae bacterium]|nr:CGNR zinc finger domain-containing protein [Gemmatimonadaceae bacterium]
MPRRAKADDNPFTFLGGRLWLDFVNTDDALLGLRRDTIASFERFVVWLEGAQVVDSERAVTLQRRATEQPSGAAAALVEARRVRAALRALAERGRGPDGERARESALAEINRLLGRSVGTRRVEISETGRYVRSFVPTGDAFGGLVIPVVESAVDSLVADELPRIRVCADRRCPRVFLDQTKSRTRRWCDMATCGNRAKALRLRRRRANA